MYSQIRILLLQTRTYKYLLDNEIESRKCLELAKKLVNEARDDTTKTYIMEVKQ